MTTGDGKFFAHLRRLTSVDRGVSDEELADRANKITRLWTSLSSDDFFSRLDQLKRIMFEMVDWDVFKAYLEIDRKFSTKRESLYTYKQRYHALYDYFKGIGSTFSRESFNTFIAHERTRGLGNSTLNKYISLGKLVDKYLGKNELREYGYFKESRVIPRIVLTPDEELRIANVVCSYQKFKDVINRRQRTLIMLLATTGCRIGEALYLERKNVFPEFVRFMDTKSGDTRDVPISDGIYKQLCALQPNQGLVFQSGRNKQLTTKAINDDIQMRAKLCHITKSVSCHLFRHSYITEMLELGVDWLDLSVIVGHKDPKTTLKYKQSLLGHYRDIAHLHPLLRGQMTWGMLTKRIKELTNQTVDTRAYGLKIDESGSKITIEVRVK